MPIFRNKQILTDPHLYQEGNNLFNFEEGFQSGNGRFTFENDFIDMRADSPENGQIMLETKIDLTNVNTLSIDWDASDSFGTQPNATFGVSTTPKTVRRDTFDVGYYSGRNTGEGDPSVGGNFSRRTITINVSSLSGEYYVAFGNETSSTSTQMARLKVYNVFVDGDIPIIPTITKIYKGEVKDGFALEFNGSSDYVEVNSKVVADNSEEVSYQVKFNYDGSGGGTDGRRFLLESFPVWALSFCISSSNEMQIFQNTKGDNVSFDTGFFVSTNRDYDMTVTWKRNGNIKLYVDGDLVFTESVGSSFLSDINGLNIGTYRNADNRWYGGLIKELTVWEKELTVQEIQQYVQSSPIGNENNLVAYYKFDEGTGTTLGDSAGNNDGTIVGADWVTVGKIPANENSAVIKRILLGDDKLVFGLPRFIEATGGIIETYEENGVFYKSHTFTTSGTFEVTSGEGEVDYLVIGGGGSGGSASNNRGGGGGGAGGYRTTIGTSGGNSISENKFVIQAGVNNVIVGAGGPSVRADSANNGSPSSFSTIISEGGGGGGGTNANGFPGGSGGGSRGSTGGFVSGSSGTANQGFDGGGSTNSSNILSRRNGGGGGGAGEIGGSSINSNVAGKGGDGLGNIIRTGSIEFRAGGGGGGVYSGTVGQGGLGGGGNGGRPGQAGAANTGSGGGGADRQESNNFSGAGGSGIVIIRYEVGGL